MVPACNQMGYPAMRFYTVLGCLFLLSACTSPLQKLKEINPTANDFSSSLASEYLAYADSEAEQGRKVIAEYYADKGLKANKGETVEPEKVDTTLSEASQQELSKARTKLMALLVDDIKRVAPQKLARTQLLFDCWQHEVSRRINEETAPCGDEFASDLSELQVIADSFVYNDETTYTFPFTKNTRTLSKENQDGIDEIVSSIGDEKNYKIEIEGYTCYGAKRHKWLSMQLAEIRRALIVAGIPAKHIHSVTEASSKAVTFSCHVDNSVDVTVKIHTPVKD